MKILLVCNGKSTRCLVGQVWLAKGEKGKTKAGSLVYFSFDDIPSLLATEGKILEPIFYFFYLYLVLLLLLLCTINPTCLFMYLYFFRDLVW